MSSRCFKNIMVAGAGGTIGAPIVTHLLSSGKFNVFALSRPDSTATFPLGVTVRKADLTSKPQLVEALREQDVVICTWNDAAAELQSILVEAAFEAGVRRFLPNEWASHELNMPGTPMEEIKAGKQAIIDQLGEKSRLAKAAGTEFHWTGINNGTFFDWALRAAFIDIALPPVKTATIWDSGTNRTTFTNVQTVATAVVSVLTTAEAGTRNRLVNIESFSASQNEVVAALQRSTGERWTIAKTTTEDQLDFARQSFETGDFLSAFYRWVRAYIFSKDGKQLNVENELLCLPREDLQTTVDRIIKDIRV